VTRNFTAPWSDPTHDVRADLLAAVSDAPEVRIGDWMQTYTGRAFYPLDPRQAEIDPIDIAHGLSMTCRYNGHVSRFYSVAEHCVKMSEAVSPENALWALLHDATESYVGDVIRPLKKHLPDYVDIEDHLMRVICARFGLTVFEMPAEVKAADNRILLTERAALLGPTPLPWHSSLEDLDPLPVKIDAWDPPMAEAVYLMRLNELTS